MYVYSSNSSDLVISCCSCQDSDGVDLYFFNSAKSYQSVTSAEAVQRVFREVEPRRSTPTASALKRITEPYMQRLEAWKANPTAHPKPKPLNLVCLTDGAPNRGEEPEAMIIDLAKRLDAGRYPLFQLGIQFIQIGDDPEARVRSRSFLPRRTELMHSIERRRHCNIWTTT